MKERKIFLNTKTIIIALITLVLLGTAVTGVVLFLRDSGEAEAIDEQGGTLPVAGSDGNVQTIPEDNGEMEESEETINAEGEIVQTSIEGETRTLASGTSIETEPTVSTTTQTRKIGETLELNWSPLKLNVANLNNLEINYLKVNYRIEYYKDSIFGEKLGTDLFEEEYGREIKETDVDLEKYLPTGYKFGNFEGVVLTEIESNNIAKVVYVPRTDISYTVNYYIENTTTKIADSKVVENQTFGTKVTEEAIDLRAKGYDKVAPTIKKIASLAVEGNEINFYYTARKDISYIVNYYIENTTTKIADSKVVENQTFGTKVTEEAIDLRAKGYDKVAPTTKEIASLAVEGNEINFYYTARKDISYTVNYYIENTTTKIADSKVVENQTFGTKVTEEAIDLRAKGYDKVAPTTKEIASLAVGGNEINFYYTKASFDYSIEFYKNGSIMTNDTIKVIKGRAKYQSIVSVTEKQIQDNCPDGYSLSQVNPTSKSIIISTISLNNVIKVYYSKPEISATKTSITDSNSANLHEGDNITYKIVASNRGLVDGRITISDQIDISKLKINSITVNGANIDVPTTGVITWTGEIGKNNANVTMIISTTVKVLPTGIYTISIGKNIANVNNNPVGDNKDYIVVKSNILSEKTSTTNTTAEKGKIHVGDTITYTIKVWNIGSEDKKVTVTDSAPTGTTLVADSEIISAGSKSINGGIIKWTVDVPKNTSKENAKTLTFKITVNNDATGIITNTAALDEGPDPKDEEEYSIVTPANITVRKTANKTGSVEPGDIIKYTLTATNSGDEEGTVTIKDTIPEGTSLEGNISATGTTANTAESLAKGITVKVIGKGSAKVEFSVKVLASALGKTIKNTAYYDDKQTEEVINGTTKEFEVVANAGITKTKGLNYILVADASYSMWWNFIPGTTTRRKAAAESAVNSFIKKVFAETPDAKVELIEFSRGASHNKTYTNGSSYKVDLNTKLWVTDIKAGLELAKSYRVSTTKNVIILLSDGKPEARIGPSVETNPDKLAQVADGLEDGNTSIYCIGFGSDANSAGTEAYKVLQKISTNGKVLTSGDANGLVSNFTEIMYSTTPAVTVKADDITKVFDLGTKQLDSNKEVIISYNGGVNKYTFTNLGTQGPLTYSNTSGKYLLTFDLTNYADKSNLQITYYVK